MGLTEYRIFLDGRLLDTASTLSYRHFLSLRGQHTYGVSAVTAAGESPGAMAAVRWTGPVAFGIPFADDFENGFGGWYQVGSSGVPSMMMQDSAYEGRYAAGIKTYPSDYTALARPFNVTDGADIETWFCMDAFPGSEGGGGSIMLLALGALVLARRWGTALPRRVAALNLGVALWNLDVLLLFTAPDGGTAALIDRLFQAPIIALPFLALLFCFVFLGRRLTDPLLVGFGAWGALLVAASAGPLYFTGWRRLWFGWYGTPGPLYVFFVAYLLVYLALSTALLAWRKALP